MRSRSSLHQIGFWHGAGFLLTLLWVMAAPAQQSFKDLLQKGNNAGDRPARGAKKAPADVKVELVRGAKAGTVDLVVSNPPYIPTAVWEELEALVREHEPKLALDGGNDGLEAIRAVAINAAEALAPEGWLVLEHHHDHNPAVLQLLRDAGLERVHAYQDLEGNPRFAAARRPGP